MCSNSKSSNPLVLRVPNFSIPPVCQSVIDNYNNRVDVITDDHIAQYNRERVQGILTYGLHTIDSSVMDSFPRLRVIANCYVGTDNVDIEEAKRRGIKIGNTPNVIDECVADQGFALLLASTRNIVLGDGICKNPSTTQVNNKNLVMISGS